MSLLFSGDDPEHRSNTSQKGEGEGQRSEDAGDVGDGEENEEGGENGDEDESERESGSRVAGPSQVPTPPAELVAQWNLLYGPPPITNERPPEAIKAADIEAVIAEGTALEIELETQIQRQKDKPTATHEDWYAAPDVDIDSEAESDATDRDAFVNSINEEERREWQVAADEAFPASDSDTDFSDDE